MLLLNCGEKETKHDRFLWIHLFLDLFEAEDLNPRPADRRHCFTTHKSSNLTDVQSQPTTGDYTHPGSKPLQPEKKEQTAAKRVGAVIISQKAADETER